MDDKIIENAVEVLIFKMLRSTSLKIFYGPNMKKVLIVGLFTILSTSAFSAVIKSVDADNSCTLYKVVAPDSDGKVTLNPGEVMIEGRDTYGLTFKEMEIDFDKREVLVQPMMNIVLWADRPLIPTKASIPESHPDFNFLINHLNRKIYVFDRICITDDNQIAYAKEPESTESKSK